MFASQSLCMKLIIFFINCFIRKRLFKICIFLYFYSIFIQYLISHSLCGSLLNILLFIVIEGGSVRSCMLEFRHAGESDFSKNCMNKDNADSGATVYSGSKLIQVLKISYEVEFPLYDDLPQIPSEYMVKAPIGLSGSHVQLSVRNKGN